MEFIFIQVVIRNLANYWKLKKSQKHCNIFVVFIKTSFQSEEHRRSPPPSFPKQSRL